jgi:hypothetical protein
MAAPLSEQLRRIPEEFPELAGGGMLGNMFTGVILPQMITAAKKDEDGTRERLVGIVRRLVRLLEIDPADITTSAPR